MQQPTSPPDLHSLCTMSCKRYIKLTSTRKHVCSTSALLHQQPRALFKHEQSRTTLANTISATCTAASSSHFWSAHWWQNPELLLSTCSAFLKGRDLNKLGPPCKSSARECVQTGIFSPAYWESVCIGGLREQLCRQFHYSDGVSFGGAKLEEVFVGLLQSCRYLQV